ncbi:procollagen-lysine,2-oxoglutarate 5-dioxygenase 1-like [Glandiceps talaboti]
MAKYEVVSAKSLCALFLITVCLVVRQSIVAADEGKEKFVVLTVATDETDGYKRFIRSAKKYDLADYIEVLGMGEEWKGGDMLRFTGGGQKIKLMKAAMEKYKDDPDLIVMFTDSYDVVFTAGPDEILKRFREMDTRVVFSSEIYLWPDTSLQDQYPKVEKGMPYLNSGMFIGYAPEIWQIVSKTEIGNRGDDQLYYTKIYLDPELRKELNIKLDNLAVIFQNLNGVTDNVKLMFEGKNSMLHNKKYKTVPAVVHGNGAAKVYLDHLGNYLANSWTPESGCLSCQEDLINLKDTKLDDYPSVLIGIFMEESTPFAAEFLEYIAELDYPKKKIDLFIHNAVTFHEVSVLDFLDKYTAQYHSVRELPPGYGLSDHEARNRALNYCLQLKTQYFFSVDSITMVTNPDTLKILIEQNKNVVAPLIVRPFKLWSNFWGALSEDGFYSRAEDYTDIVKGTKRGLWNVPFLNSIYLVKSEAIEKYRPSYLYSDLDSDMAFCRHLREQGIFMYVINTVFFGRLLDNENFKVYMTQKHPDMYQIYDNRIDWEQKYIHPGYNNVLEPETNITMPCTDVYSFPLMSETFAKHLIEEAEYFGRWSDGSNTDPRLQGGYENVPTRDIHMNQLNFEQHWLTFLKDYVCPVQEKVFPGYYSRASAVMNFVVRYRPDEQPALRPHHDSSTFTINVALNKRGVDYEGGGAKFIRQNCSVIGLDVGHSLMHPGRLTHFHEGLRTTSGTRYIMVSFIDP